MKKEIVVVCIVPQKQHHSEVIYLCFGVKGWFDSGRNFAVEGPVELVWQLTVTDIPEPTVRQQNQT